MLLSKIQKSAQKLRATLGNIVAPANIDRGYDPYEREPVTRSEISAMFELSYGKKEASRLTPKEESEQQNLYALRDTLYPRPTS